MTSYNPVVKNAAGGALLYTMLEPRTPTGGFLDDPTLAAGDVKISIDGGAFANLGTLPVVTPAGGAAVKITLSQAETNGDNLVIHFRDAAGDEWNDRFIPIETVARQFDDLPLAAENATALLDLAAGVETNRTLRQALRLMLAALAGKASGLETTTAVYRDTNDTKDRISATVDADGNRTAVTLDPS